MNKISRFDRYRYTILWLAEHFFDSIKKVKKSREKLSTSISNKISNKLAGLGENGENHIPVPVIEGMNIEEFIKNYRKKSIPVVLKNAASSWALYKKWNPEFFAKKYPDDPVILFDAAIESKDLAYTEGKKTKTVSLLEFVESMNNGGKDYARLLPILDQHPELLKDLDVDWLMSAANNGAREVHAYISHGVLSDPAIERIEKSSLSSLVVTDSISIISKIKESTKIRIIPTAPLFAQALLNIANGNSVSSLFDSERLRPIYKPYYPKYHIEKKRKA